MIQTRTHAPIRDAWVCSKRRGDIPEKPHLSYCCVASRLQLIEIRAAGQFSGIEHNRVVPRRGVTLAEYLDLLPESNELSGIQSHDNVIAKEERQVADSCGA